MLAAVLAQHQGAELLAEGRVEAAGADRRQLAGIADEDRLPAGCVDQLEQRREHARFCQARLVDDQDTAVGEPAVAVSLQEQPVQRAAWDAGGEHELVGGAAARRPTDDRNARLAVDVSERTQGRRLTRARDSDDAHDAVAAQ